MGEREQRRALQLDAEAQLCAALASAAPGSTVAPAPSQGGPTVWIWHGSLGEWRQYFVRLTEIKP